MPLCVFGVVHQFLHLFYGMYVWNNEAMNTDVQQFQYSGTADFPYPCQRRNAAKEGAADIVQCAFRLKGAVFVVNDDEVQAGFAQGFRYICAAQFKKCTDGLLMVLKFFFQRIFHLYHLSNMGRTQQPSPSVIFRGRQYRRYVPAGTSLSFKFSNMGMFRPNSAL